MEKFEIRIGKVFDATKNIYAPKQTLIVNKDQLAIIEQFASQRKDSELNTIYKLNDCEFTVFPHINMDIKRCIKDKAYPDKYSVCKYFV